MHGTELESDFYKATTLPNTKPLTPSQVAQPATPNSRLLWLLLTPSLHHHSPTALPRAYKAKGRPPPAPSSPFSLQHSWVVQTPGNATRWIRAQTKLLLASCNNTTGLWIPCSIGWKQQRGTARLVLKAEVLSQTTYHLKNLLCSSDMCYFPIIRN